MVSTVGGVKTPTLAATFLGSAILAGIIVALMSSATSSKPQIPMPRPRPYLIYEAPVIPTQVRTIPIVKSDPGVVQRHEPPEIYGEPTTIPPRAYPNTSKPPRAMAEISDRPARSDVCARHNMRKVFTRGGRSWRCRR